MEIEGTQNSNITDVSSSVGGSPSSNVVENVPTIDMSGTNVEGATNTTDKAKEAASAPPEETPNIVKSVKTKSNEVRVRLFSPHTHEGIEYEKGDIIYVDESSADYIDKAKAGKRV